MAFALGTTDETDAAAELLAFDTRPMTRESAFTQTTGSPTAGCPFTDRREA